MTKHITYPPKNVVYRSASTSTTTINNSNRNEAPGWLRTRDYLLTGGSSEYQTGKSVSSSNNMRSASKPSGQIPAWISCAMYGTGTVPPESPSKEEIERSLPYNYSNSPDVAKDQYIKSQIRSAAKQMNIPTPKPAWLRLREGLD